MSSRVTSSAVAVVRQDLRRTGLAVVGLLTLVLAALSGQPQADAAAPIDQKVGIVCTYGEAGPTGPIFNLTTKTGYIDLPDGNTAFMWGVLRRARRVPAPQQRLSASTRATR